MNINIDSRGLSDGLYTLLNNLDTFGKEVKNDRTDSLTKELVFCNQQFANPKDRILDLKGRNSNIVAQIAETLWVLFGSNEIKYIEPFLPRASDFSDDGEKWRAGYGSRIRGWKEGNVSTDDWYEEFPDQLNGVIETLKADLTSRQAYMVIPIPSRDMGIKTKDHPCTQIVNFIVRDNKLHCGVRMRSNDAIWGFSGINYFEFTFIQEIIAGILGVEIGEYNHSVVSMHIYDKHFETMEKILTQNLDKGLIKFNNDKHISPSFNLKLVLEVDYIGKAYLEIFNKIQSGDRDSAYKLYQAFKFCYKDYGLFEYCKIPLITLFEDFKFAMKELESIEGSYLHNSLMASQFFYKDDKRKLLLNDK